MALIRLGLGSQASGSLGGTVFSRNRGGAYVRARSVPVNVNSPRQVFVRGSLTALSFLWSNTLTPEQRASWNLYAQNTNWTNTLGENMFLSGFNMFIRTNTSRRDAGLADVLDAPTTFTLGELPTPPVATLDVSAQTASIVFTNTDPWAAEEGGFLSLYMGRPFNVGVTFFAGPWQYLGTVPGDSPAPSSPALFTSLPFPVALGQQIAVRWRAGTADGRVSPYGRAIFLPVA